MTAQEIMAYGCVIGAFALMGLTFILREKALLPLSVKNDEQERKSLPSLFRFVYPLLEKLDLLGLGHVLVETGSRKMTRLERQLMVGDFHLLTPQLVACAQLVYALALGGAGALLILAAVGGVTRWTGVAAAGGFWLGWVLPTTAIEGAADRRQTEIVRSLPFAIDLIGAAMRSGSNFGDAVRFYVTQGGVGPLTSEFARLMKQVQLGMSLAAALEEMARRVGAKEFTGFVSAVVHSLETGAALVDTLNIHGEELRRVRFNIAEQKAARAPSLMILPIALFIMPAVFIIVFVPVYLKVQASGMSGMFAK
jgi:hypothetical protein